MNQNGANNPNIMCIVILKYIVLIIIRNIKQLDIWKYFIGSDNFYVRQKFLGSQ